MSTTTSTRTHDDAVALVREAVSQYLPYARAQRRDLDNESWLALMGEVLDVVARTR
ncbi:hypothetical protein EDD28_2523 [Salana multivorans]|uniref:Uncharacterized protein n=1 Tax=Salana multivorans TaxID=120377 RepID=A0A3N2D031_9MICO|nr:hypothetical protein [Salana multivorans]ROR93116.1 hypothetical protein EDD28_2523 [Salana multivorans]